MISLAQFAKLFKNESDLREKLAVLFRKMPQTQGVRITHGTVERGKDIVFHSKDALGGWLLNACVVKNSQITGSVESNRGAKTVLFQAEQALDTPLVGDNGVDLYASTVYVITPHECSQAAMLSIQGKLAQRRGQVQFLCGTRLLELFEQYSPETLIFDSTFLGTYVLQLQKKLRSIDPIRFLMQNHDLVASGLKSFESVYVRQNFMKTVSRFEAHLMLTTTFPQMTETLDRPGFQEIFARAQFLLSLISDGQLWEEGEEEKGKIAADSLLVTLRELKDQFDTRFEVANRTARPRQYVAATGRGPEVEIDASVSKKFTLAVDATEKIIKTVLRRMNEANIWALQSKDILNELGTPEFLNYCRIEELVNLHPTAFRRTDRSIRTLGAGLLSSTSAPLLITAAAGYGKTSFCKWHVLENIKLLEEKQTDIVPFYVPLHQHATQALGSCEETFLQDPELVQLLKDLNAEGKRMRIFLDGLDEVTTGIQQRDLMVLAQKLSASYSNLQVIVTARNHVSGPWLRWLSRIDLAELTGLQSRELVAKWLGQDSEDFTQFYDQLERARTLEPLSRIPLLCTLVIAVFKRSGALPATRASLYEVFVELMCGGWDLAKNIRRTLRFGVSQKKDVLTRLAGILHLDGRREATEHDFKVAVGDVAMSANNSWRDMLDEILEDSLVTRVGENITFSHLSFQEYLAAKDLSDPSGRRQAFALREYIRGREWWAEVLAFYLSSSARADEMEQWVSREFKKTKSRSPDYSRRMNFLTESIRSSSEGWVPREHQFNFEFLSD